MSAASISPGSAAPGLDFEDYSLYSNLSDEELLQLAMERSLTDTTSSKTNTTSPPSPHQPDGSMHSAAPDHDQVQANCSHNPPPSQTSAHYSSPNPPAEKPPDLYVSSHSFDCPASCCEDLSGAQKGLVIRSTLVW